MSTIVTDNIIPHGTTLDFAGGIEVDGGATFSSGITVGASSCADAVTVVSGITVSDLSVGNVLPILSNQISGNLPVVGCVLPFIADYLNVSGVTNTITNTTIPEGKWFLYCSFRENGNVGGQPIDEDPYAVMAKVWDIPSGKHLRIVLDGAETTAPLQTGYTTGIFYQIGNTSGFSDLVSLSDGNVGRSQLAGLGFTEFVVGDNANSYTNAISIADGTDNGLTIYGTNSRRGNGSGFAIRLG